MKLLHKPIKDGNTVKAYAVGFMRGKQFVKVAEGPANPMNHKHKCGGTIHKLQESSWGQWYVCGKCCADLSYRTDLRSRPIKTNKKGR